MIRATLLLLAGVLLAWQAAAAELPVEGWVFSNGPEHPGATGKLRVNRNVPFNGKKSLELTGDFRKGGDYVAAIRTLEPAVDFREFQFKLKGNISRAAVRFLDSDGQYHHYFVPLTGNPAVWQCVEVSTSETSEHHWGGRNDGVVRGPIRKIFVLVHKSGLSGQTGGVRLADFRTFENRSAAAKELQLPATAAWNLSRDAESPPGADGKPLTLKIETSKVVARYNLSTPLQAKRLKFDMRGANRNISVLFTDWSGQLHIHELKASGNPAETQNFVIEVAGSKNHWGGEKDGIFHAPLTSIEFCVRGEYCGAGEKEETELRNIVLETDGSAATVLWTIADPVALFRYLGDASPVQIQAHFPESPKPEQLRYSYRDYEGSEIASGTATYDAARYALSAPPPAGRGFFELCYPELGIRLGLTVDEPPPTELDEYFAMDSLFSWEGPPFDEGGIRNLVRILKRNGFAWNRDRIRWPVVEKERGKFNFTDRRVRDRHGIYRQIAAEEGLKGLDVFHDTPSWNCEQPQRLPRQDPLWNPYPVNLLAAGESWSTIMKHWGTTRALEVWNEPDVGFGNNFPAEYATAFTKAVSRSFVDNGVDTLVVGGVFAHTLPGTNFYKMYIDNGLLDDSDVISFHSYAEVSELESDVAAMRQTELDSKSPRAGIPYWLTECGKPRPWAGVSRGTVEPDLYSAAEIVGKAVELRALGLERYFVFELKPRKENRNNFAQLDANQTPMRSMAAYCHLTRALAHRDYVGDLKGCGSIRGRVFEGKDDLVAVLYNGTRNSRKLFVPLPKGFLAQRATGIDGRPLPIKNGSVANVDGITYVYFGKAEKQKFVDPETSAMKLYRLAKAYRPQPRAAKPLVLQPLTDLSQSLISNRGLFVAKAEVDLKFRVNNFGKTALVFAPKVELPKGAELLTQPEESVTVPARGTAEIAFRARLAPNTADFQAIKVGDRNGNATPIAFSLSLISSSREEVVLSAMPEGTKSPTTLAELEKLGNWVDFSAPANWTPWELDKMTPDIKAKFRGFYTPRELVLQVLVRDEQHVNANSASDAWLGDSVQLTVQPRSANKLPVRVGSWYEITAAQCKEGQTLYAHISWQGRPRGKLTKSKLNFRPLGKNWFLYEIRLNGGELGLSLKPGSVIGSTLLVNSNPGRGRAGFLSWGGGISPTKFDAMFQILLLK